MIGKILVWVIPPIMFYFLVYFIRKNLETPKVKRVWYLATIPMLIPILGLILFLITIVIFIGVFTNEEVTFKKDSKFYKKWLTE